MIPGMVFVIPGRVEPSMPQGPHDLGGRARPFAASTERIPHKCSENRGHHQ